MCCAELGYAACSGTRNHHISNLVDTPATKGVRHTNCRCRAERQDEHKGAVTIGRNKNGTQKRKYFYGKTRTEVSKKMTAALKELQDGKFVDASTSRIDQAMIEVVAQGLGIAMTVFPLVGFQIVAGSFFQYIGRAPLAMFLSATRQLLFLLPMLLILPKQFGAMGAWMSMPIADSCSVVVAGTLLFIQIRKLRRMEHNMHFSH